MPQEIDAYEIIRTRREARTDLTHRIREIRALRNDMGRRLITNSALRQAFRREFTLAEDSRVTPKAVQRRLTNFIRNYPDLFAWGNLTEHLPCGMQDYRGDAFDALVRGFFEEFQVYQALVRDEAYRD